MILSYFIAVFCIGLTLLGIDTCIKGWRAHRREVAVSLFLSAFSIFLSTASIALALHIKQTLFAVMPGLLEVTP